MKTANLAIVFTDIKGFTERTSRQTLEQNQRMLQAHHALLAPLFKAFGGRIVKSIGDAFLATFESPTQAVLSGVAIQDRLWHYNRGVPEAEQLHVRVAINVGEVRLEANDVFGEPVNIAARVEGIAEAGEVYFTEAVYLAMNKAEVPSREVGAFELKGIPGKIRVFQVPRAPYRVEAPGAGAIAEAPGEESLPPYGNLGLSRVPESLLDGGGDLSALGQRAAALGQRAAAGAVVLGQQATVLGRQARTAGGSLVSRMMDALRARGVQGPAGLSPRTLKVLAVGGCVAVLSGVGLVVLTRDPALRAIGAVESAPKAERDPLVKEARRIIGEEKDAGRRFYLQGRLDEAQENTRRSLDDYARAVKAGSAHAEDRIAELLAHPQCGVRSAAVDAVRSLKLKSALGALEDLAETRGADDGTGGLFGVGKCDSQAAAQSALKVFKD
ncbi:adenylate/guanylate cyclase domain-containing protein [Myxococcus sp. K15C18031901]|uniref:adenylate/guanylate cyclase domain-containing protein n=1 Tax=Myxococcus dinghuensis TaxID=2906761 RepID=UPI0020A71891|nr:adenylate/guanylate cyclase domain-containing protein [Myxococcus dinghuensis]MCP3100878.1 adenylate/guanylate cyclase domain-containing protein [Myxococcus dinghuensis]